jgi:GNAT superfamily N-acetyltransferase
MTGGIQIQPVRTAEDTTAFIRFPYRLLGGDPHWVPPLLMERKEFYDPLKNPVYEYAQVQLFLARRDGQVAGTIAAVHNTRYGQFHPDEAQVGFFGAFDCGPDQAVADALFGAAQDWLRQQGKPVMRGPVNLTTNDVVGLLVEGFDEDPALMMPYNPAYYPGLFQAAGFAPAKDLYAFAMRTDEYDGRLKRVADRLTAGSHVRIRSIDMKHWEDELAFVRTCYNEAWANNWGFVPWTDRELEYIARELKPLVDPRLAHMAEIDGAPCGFAISVPDANEALKLARGRLFPLGLLRLFWKLKVSKCSRIRTIAMGVLPRHRKRGLDALLVHHLVESTEAAGYHQGEMGWILADNQPMLSAIRQLGARRSKVYRVYDRAVS